MNVQTIKSETQGHLESYANLRQPDPETLTRECCASATTFSSRAGGSVRTAAQRGGLLSRVEVGHASCESMMRSVVQARSERGQ
jgi:hypothetical protein